MTAAEIPQASHLHIVHGGSTIDVAAAERAVAHLFAALDHRPSGATGVARTPGPPRRVEGERIHGASRSDERLEIVHHIPRVDVHGRDRVQPVRNERAAFDIVTVGCP